MSRALYTVGPNDTPEQRAAREERAARKRRAEERTARHMAFQDSCARIASAQESARARFGCGCPRHVVVLTAAARAEGSRP
jgi:hypothetical protein